MLCINYTSHIVLSVTNTHFTEICSERSEYGYQRNKIELRHMVATAKANNLQTYICYRKTLKMSVTTQWLLRTKLLDPWARHRKQAVPFIFRCDN